MMLRAMIAATNATAEWAAKLGVHPQSSTLKFDESGKPFHFRRAEQILAYRAVWVETSFFFHLDGTHVVGVYQHVLTWKEARATGSCTVDTMPKATIACLSVGGK
jgi:hypothetical protein